MEGLGTDIILVSDKHRERMKKRERGKESCRSHSSLVFTSSFSFFSPPIMSFYIYFFNLLILLFHPIFFSYLYRLVINCTHKKYSSTSMTIITLACIRNKKLRTIGLRCGITHKFKRLRICVYHFCSEKEKYTNSNLII